jgi:hypothetical protein
MFFALAALAAASTAHIEMSEIQARLFYSDTARLSDDLLARKKPFVFWNTIIGEGDAEENADDMLVSVTLRADEGNEQNIDGPVTIEATDEKGKVLGTRTARNLLTSPRGSTTVGLWLNDVTCAGAVTVQARYADQVKTAVLKMDCGE